MIAIALLAVALAAEPAPAPRCAPSPYQPAAVLDLVPTGAQGQQNAQMLISATLLLEIDKADAAHARSATEPCPLGSVQASGNVWELAGGDRSYVRRAVNSDPAKPVAFVYPFADMLALMAASKARTSPPPSHNVLVTSTGSLDTLWRAYVDLPSDAQLQTDLTAVLGGRSSPIASVDILTKKVTVMVGAKSG